MVLIWCFEGHFECYSHMFCGEPLSFWWGRQLYDLCESALLSERHDDSTVCGRFEFKHVGTGSIWCLKIIPRQKETLCLSRRAGLRSQSDSLWTSRQNFPSIGLLIHSRGHNDDLLSDPEFLIRRVWETGVLWMILVVLFEDLALDSKRSTYDNSLSADLLASICRFLTL